MAGVFVSYRVADTGAHAGRLADALKARLASREVFLSADDLEKGTQWREEILKEIEASRVVLAVIGPQWSTVRDRDGIRRLDRDDDVVRLEIREALARGTPVVPVLVGGAMLPSASDLPEDMTRLLERNAVELRDSHWASDVAVLVDGLQRLATLRVRNTRGLFRSSRRLIGVALALLILVTAAHWLLVRLDVLPAESLRLLPALLTAVFAGLFLAHLAALRRNP
jgi:hypothetical protein